MKPALIILHGALGCKEQFIEWKKVLSEKFDCYLMDFSGHGNKARENVVFSIETFSNELNEFIEQQHLRQPSIVGYSMGGYVALHSALHNPELIGNIVTIATKFDWNIESSKREAGYLQPELMEAKVPKLVAQLKERHGEYWKNVVGRTAVMMLKLGENPLLTHKNIKNIDRRIKFCVGENDKMVSDAETFAMFQNAAHGHYCCLPDTGHLPETMAAELIKAEVEDYLLGLAD